jgi:hypothetical protein
VAAAWTNARTVSACRASPAMQPTTALSIRLVFTVIGRTRKQAILMPGAACTYSYVACAYVHKHASQLSSLEVSNFAKVDAGEQS